jgi:hypothetical protein
MSIPQQQIPTVSQILQACASPILRRRAMMAILRVELRPGWRCDVRQIWEEQGARASGWRSVPLLCVSLKCQANSSGKIVVGRMAAAPLRSGAVVAGEIRDAASVAAAMQSAMGFADVPKHG